MFKPESKNLMVDCCLCNKKLTGDERYCMLSSSREGKFIKRKKRVQSEGLCDDCSDKWINGKIQANDKLRKETDDTKRSSR